MQWRESWVICSCLCGESCGGVSIFIAHGLNKGKWQLYYALVNEQLILHLYMHGKRLQSSVILCNTTKPCRCFQEAAMVVPPLRRSRICWQSCSDRRSPTRSRVRLASASRRARCPGGVSRGIGRWRQASKIAWALSLSPSERKMNTRNLCHVYKYRTMSSKTAK